MKRFYCFLAGLQLALFMSACAKSLPTARPDWIENPGTGVSASAGMHVRGNAMQEELAVLRGREEYAKRFGVNIHSTQTISTTISNNRASTVGSQLAHEESNQSNVKTRVKAKWHDTDSDVLWVWLVPSDQ